ncbi:hypothetical protein HL658_29300 [Azospirillum sp. RWY-5-1]|uniref:ChrR-like cupin domain-containing protein n=1 Tax=Azospirillum oleiclasticum TaxID=2735135 RepID=A0ABX2TIH6_9PROT|nr:ChrR family anti-sigma-E factor [Azospirillum oleiclasticum]NYZ16662.1 hypothetical protein [Azospirillum oleiclasticum]NYZ24149.1 hypothetical protein [Azospirillum oleiclasticum]
MVAVLPNQHPEEERLLAYATGSLGEVKSLLVATHLALCPLCRASVEAYEAECGGWFDGLGGGAEDDRWSAMLAACDARLDTAVLPPPAPRSTLPMTGPLVPEPLRGRLGRPLFDFGWNEIAPAVWLSDWTVKDAQTTGCLLRMGPGAPVPPHHHSANEMLLVLTGAFHDEYGHYRVGDVADIPADTDHYAVAEHGGDCVCLFLLDGEIRFL